MLKRLKEVIKEEKITFTKLFNPVFMFKLMIKFRYIHFLIVGGTGVLLNLVVTWLFTTFVFGLENYFHAFLIGLAVNLTYTFILYSRIIFKVKKDPYLRFGVFVLYSLAMAWFQATLVKTITPIVGLEFYLLVIMCVAMILSIVNFLVFKLKIFKNKV